MIILKDGRRVFPSTGIGDGRTWIAVWRKPNGSLRRFRPILSHGSEADIIRELTDYAFRHTRDGVRIIYPAKTQSKAIVDGRGVAQVSGILEGVGP